MNMLKIFAATCGGVSTKLISCSDSDNGIYGVLGLILNIFLVIAAILAACGIVWTGIVYITSRDNANQVTSAKKRLLNIIIGLSAYLLLFSLAEFLIPGGIQNVFNLASDNSEDTTIASDESSFTVEPSPTTPDPEPEPEPEPKPTNPTTPEPEPKLQPQTISLAVEDHGTSYRTVTLSSGAIPYVYVPTNKNQATLLNSLQNSSNVIAIMNAGTYNMSTYALSGITISNNKIISDSTTDITLLFDQTGNQPGFTKYRENGATAESLLNGSAKYYDIYGNLVTGKIQSAVSGLSPIVINNKITYEYTYVDIYQNGYSSRSRQVLCVKSGPIYQIITNKNDNSSQGWNYEKIGQAALDNGCIFAFNLDGGGSVMTATRPSTEKTFDYYYTSHRNVATYIVFTADNLPPKLN